MEIEWDSVWASVKKVCLVPTCLQGHENILFQRHKSFKNAQTHLEPPLMRESRQFGSLAKIYKCATSKQKVCVFSDYSEYV